MLPGRPTDRVLRELPLPCGSAELVDLAKAAMPDGLVEPGAWKRLAKIRDPLPPIATEGAIECRLEAGPAQVDFEMCLRPARRPRLADALSGAGLRDAESPGWRRATALLRQWVDPTSLLHEALAAVWLEFDVPATESEPDPFAILTLDAALLYASGSASPSEVLRPLRRGLDLLADGLDADAARGLEDCVRGLPGFVQVLHAAVRPSPDGDLTRIVVRAPWRSLLDTLEALRWPGDREELGGVLEHLCESTLVHSVNLDVGRSLGPRVGIEFHHPTSLAEDPRWRALFDALEERGACTSEKRQALARWISEPIPADAAPGSIHVRRELLIKVVYEPGCPLRAKAYLPFSPRLLLG